MKISNIDHRTCPHPEETLTEFSVSGVTICQLCGHRTAYSPVLEKVSRTYKIIWSYVGTDDLARAVSWIKSRYSLTSKGALEKSKTKFVLKERFLDPWDGFDPEEFAKFEFPSYIHYSTSEELVVEDCVIQINTGYEFPLVPAYCRP